MAQDPFANPYPRGVDSIAANPCASGRASHAPDVPGRRDISFGRSGVDASMLRRFSNSACCRGDNDHHQSIDSLSAAPRGSRPLPGARRSLIVGFGCLIGADVVWPALDARLFSHAAVERQSLGPRRLCLRARAAESAVGHRPAARRHIADRFGTARVLSGGALHVRARPGADGARDQRAGARCYRPAC